MDSNNSRDITDKDYNNDNMQVASNIIYKPKKLALNLKKNNEINSPMNLNKKLLIKRTSLSPYNKTRNEIKRIYPNNIDILNNKDNVHFRTEEQYTKKDLNSKNNSGFLLLQDNKKINDNNENNKEVYNNSLQSFPDELSNIELNKSQQHILLNKKINSNKENLVSSNNNTEALLINFDRNSDKEIIRKNIIQIISNICIGIHNVKLEDINLNNNSTLHQISKYVAKNPRKELLIDFNHNTHLKYLCNICDKIPLFPIICNYCDSLTCVFCLSDLFIKNNYSQQSIQCSNCNNSLSPYIYAVEDNIREIVNSVKIKCLRPLCDIILPYKKFVQHFFIECEYLIIKCPNALCTEEMSKIELHKHLKECLYRITYCDNCNNEMILQEKLSHDRFCKSVNVICVLCRNKIPRKDFSEHNLKCKGIHSNASKNLNNDYLSNKLNESSNFTNNEKSLNNSGFNKSLSRKGENQTDYKIGKKTFIDPSKIKEIKLNEYKNANINSSSLTSKENTKMSSFNSGKNMIKPSHVKNKFSEPVPMLPYFNNNKIENSNKLTTINSNNQYNPSQNSVSSHENRKIAFSNEKIKKISNKDIPMISQSINNKNDKIAEKENKENASKLFNNINTHRFLEELKGLNSLNIVSNELNKANEEIVKLQKQLFQAESLINNQNKQIDEIKEYNSVLEKEMDFKNTQLNVFENEITQIKDLLTEVTKKEEEMSITNKNLQYKLDININYLNQIENNLKCYICDNFTTQNLHKVKIRENSQKEVNTFVTNKKLNYYNQIKTSDMELFDSEKISSLHASKKRLSRNSTYLTPGNEFKSKKHTANSFDDSISRIEEEKGDYYEETHETKELISKSIKKIGSFKSQYSKNFSNNSSSNNNEIRRPSIKKPSRFHNEIRLSAFDLTPMQTRNNTREKSADMGFLRSNNKISKTLVNSNSNEFKIESNFNNNKLKILQKPLRLKSFNNMERKKKYSINNLNDNEVINKFSNSSVKFEIPIIKCSLCLRLICDYCCRYCFYCKQKICSKHVKECSTCKQLVCKKELNICKGCNEIFCNKCFEFKCKVCKWEFDDKNKDDMLIIDQKGLRLKSKNSLDCNPCLALGNKLINKGIHKIEIAFKNQTCKFVDVGVFVMNHPKSYNFLLNNLFNKQIISYQEEISKISVKRFAPLLFKSIPEYSIIITIDCENCILLFEAESFKYEKKLNRKCSFLPFFLNCNNEIRLKHHLQTDKLWNNINSNDI